jgi:hypothetical protein
MRAPVLLLALLLGAASAVLVACGNRNGLIPRADASGLSRHLDAVASAVAAGDCGLTDIRLTRVEGDLQNLRATGIDPRLYRRLSSGVSTLSARAKRECRTAQPQTPSVPTTSTPVTTDTTPTETNTTTTTTTTTDTTPTTPTTPSDTTTVPPTDTTPGGTGGITPDGTGGGQPGASGG